MAVAASTVISAAHTADTTNADASTNTNTNVTAALGRGMQMRNAQRGDR